MNKAEGMDNRIECNDDDGDETWSVVSKPEAMIATSVE
jgi:hypothetical protein